jgi:Ca2+/Na+ antiporter
MCIHIIYMNLYIYMFYMYGIYGIYVFYMYETNSETHSVKKESSEENHNLEAIID